MTLPRSLRISLRGVPAWARAVYLGIAGFGVLLILTAVWTGFLLALPLLALFLVAFLYTAPFVLGRRWRPPPARPTRRPVVRRRR